VSMALQRIIVLASLLVLLAFLPAQVNGYQGSGQGPAPQFEAYGHVSRVIDGDTADIYIVTIYKAKYVSMNGTTIRVRFADINAPELGTLEGERAKKALSLLLSGKYVYLDIDDLFVHDRYGRVVAVVYLPVNSTHALNVNLWLALNGYASIADYQNEFNPSYWTLYIELPMASTAAIVQRGEGVTVDAYIGVIVMVLLALAILTAVLVPRSFRR